MSAQSAYYSVVWEKEGEDSAGVFRALAAADCEGAAVAFDDLVADPETKAGSADIFRGEEGLEYSLCGLGGHARSCVGDGDD